MAKPICEYQKKVHGRENDGNIAKYAYWVDHPKLKGIAHVFVCEGCAKTVEIECKCLGRSVLNLENFK